MGGNGGNGEVSSGVGIGGNGGTATATASVTAMQGGTGNATANAIGGNEGGGATIGTAGTANANSSATTINGNAAQAQSTASGSSGLAQATAQTNFSVQSVKTTATSPISNTTAVALAQVGNSVSLPNAITPGQSFSVAHAVAFGPLMLALGSMGAGFPDPTIPLTYQESADFISNGGGTFLIHLFDSNSLGNGFDSAEFQILLNGTTLDSESFTSLAVAQTFFSSHTFATSFTGPSDVQVAFDETLSSGEGFSFDYAVATDTTPLPASLPLFAGGLGGLGLLGWRRKRKAQAL